MLALGATTVIPVNRAGSAPAPVVVDAGLPVQLVAPRVLECEDAEALWENVECVPADDPILDGYDGYTDHRGRIYLSDRYTGGQLDGLVKHELGHRALRDVSCGSGCRQVFMAAADTMWITTDHATMASERAAQTWAWCMLAGGDTNVEPLTCDVLDQAFTAARAES